MTVETATAQLSRLKQERLSVIEESLDLDSEESLELAFYDSQILNLESFLCLNSL